MPSENIEDTLRNAVMAYGIPDMIYFDTHKISLEINVSIKIPSINCV